MGEGQGDGAAVADVAARLLPGAFVEAASALLASYDDEPVRVAAGAGLPRVPAQAGS